MSNIVGQISSNEGMFSGFKYPMFDFDDNILYTDTLNVAWVKDAEVGKMMFLLYKEKMKVDFSCYVFSKFLNHFSLFSISGTKCSPHSKVPGLDLC
jgi:hypothetical protein